LYRRVDLHDVVSAHLLALRKVHELTFDKYIISATTPFGPQDLAPLRRDAKEVVRRLFPECERLYANRGWSMMPEIDRVYVNHRALTALGWQPQYDFRHALDCLQAGIDLRSPLAREVGVKGYHSTGFEQGPYPVV
jgi:UDP-glucose 4-epimerase